MLPPSYYPAFYGGEKGLRDFYVDLAAESNIPVIIYSYPGVSSGIDMSSNLISSIMKVSRLRLYLPDIRTHPLATGCPERGWRQAYRPQRWQDCASCRTKSFEDGSRRSF